VRAETTGARPLGSFPWEQVQATLFTDTAHAHNGYVAPPELSSIPTTSCQEFVASRYRPEHATIALVGRLDPSKALELAAGGIGRLAPGAASPWRRPRPVAGAARRVVVDTPAAGQWHATALGWRLPKSWLIPRRRAAFAVLAALVHGDGSSSLLRRLHDRGIRGVVRADFGMFGNLDELPEGAYLTIQAYHGPTQRDTVREALQATVETLASQPPAAEVRTAAARLVNQRRRAWADPLNLAKLLAEQRTLWSDAQLPWVVLRELTAADADAVAAAARWLASTDCAEVATRISEVAR
jgi:predicted Zn-dependent peptidase